jgi:hypothetical protein
MHSLKEGPLKLGTVFNKWTVIELNPKTPNKHTHYICRCVCGSIGIIDYHHLVRGGSKGCRACNGRLGPNVCKKGHDLNQTGKDTRGACKLCRIEQHLKRSYGITTEEYSTMFGYQLGLCAICKTPLAINEAFSIGGFGPNPRRAEVDHKHVPKKLKPQPEKRTLVRGLLCGGRYAGCNARLGRVDDVQWLRAAANYVETPPAQTLFKIIDADIKKFNEQEAEFEKQERDNYKNALQVEG